MLDRGKHLGLIASMGQLAAAVNPMLSTNWVHGVPYEAFAALRREPGLSTMVGPGERTYWALTRHADVVAASLAALCP